MIRPDYTSYEDAVYNIFDSLDNPNGVTFAPFDSEEEHAAALEDYEKFKRLTAEGPFESEEAANAAMDDLFGEDGQWVLPGMVTADGMKVRMVYTKDDPDTQTVLDSLFAVTASVNGENRKTCILPDIDTENDSSEIDFYGMSDILFPKINITEDELSVSGAGLVGDYLTFRGSIGASSLKMQFASIGLKTLNTLIQNGMGYGAAKTILFEKIDSVLTPERIEYERLMANKNEIDAILATGAERARIVASKTLAKVKKKMLG